jgi:hypothetical protein
MLTDLDGVDAIFVDPSAVAAGLLQAAGSTFTKMYLPSPGP